MSPSSSNPFGDRPDPPPPFPEEIVRAELVPEGPPDPGERLSILHLMVWTAGSAVILAFYRNTMSQAEDNPSPMNPPWLQAMTALLVSPLQGAGVAAVGLMFWRRFSGGRPFPKEPGHWLLVIAGAIALLTWPANLIIREFFRSSFEAYLLIYRLPLMVVFCVMAGYAVAKMPREALWRKMFLIWIVANIVPLFFLCVAYAEYSSYRWTRIPDLLIGVALPLAFLVTGILDRAGGARRDSLHWAGVVCRVAYLGHVAIEIVRMFLPLT